jgi:hypothetical protein
MDETSPDPVVAHAVAHDYSSPDRGSIIEPPETSALQAIHQVNERTPRTDNLTDRRAEEEEELLTNTAPSLPDDL